MKKIFLLFGALIISFTAHSQLLSKITIENQVNEANQIVEGKVISKKSYWDLGRKNIYTVHNIEVSRVLKGVKTTQISVVTIGGSVGFDIQTAHPNLELNIDDTGIFIVTNDTLSLEGHNKNPLSRVVGLSQGYYRYTKDDSKVINPFARYSSHTSLVNKISSLTAEPIISVKEVDYFPLKKKSSLNNTTLSAVAAATVAINNISPTQIVAGNESILTINGSGFGSTLGEVHFKKADDAGATEVQALDTQLVSWNDTQIKVEVPGAAGSGNIRVKNANGDENTISGLVITHSYITRVFTNSQIKNGETHEYHVHHVADYNNAPSDIFENDAYLFKYHTGFKNNNAAVDSFEDGFDDIVCKAGVDFKISSATTTIQAPAKDGVNSISFGALSSGVLGQVISTMEVYPVNYDGTTFTDAYFVLTEIDYEFNSGITWDFDLDGNTTFSEFDFNAVVRHETGHSAGLGHVIDSQKIMHYSIGTGSNQGLLSSTMYDPIKWKVTKDKNSTPPTGYNIATTDFSSCYSNSFNVKESKTNLFVIYPNPVSEILRIDGYSPILLAEIYSTTGSLISRFESVTKTVTSINVDVSHLPSGLYFLKARTNQGSQNIKFIKK